MSQHSPVDRVDLFDQLLSRMQTAGQEFVNGDPAPIKQLWSTAGDVTIFGGGGGYGHGWEQVGPSLTGGATLFRGGDGRGHVDSDIIARGISGDLAYTVGIEHGEALVPGREEPQPVALRVTNIYRWEAGSWKIIHRHADALMGRGEPGGAVPRAGQNER